MDKLTRPCEGFGQSAKAWPTDMLIRVLTQA